MESLNCTNKTYSHKKFDKLREKLRKVLVDKNILRKKQNKNATSTPSLRGNRSRKMYDLCLTPETDISLSPIKAPHSNASTTTLTESNVVGRNLKRKHITADDDCTMSVGITTKRGVALSPSGNQETNNTAPPTPSSAYSSIGGKCRKISKNSNKEKIHIVHITADDDEEYEDAAANSACFSSTNWLEEDELTNTMQFGAIKSRLRRKSANSKYSTIMHYIKTMESD